MCGIARILTHPNFRCSWQRTLTFCRPPTHCTHEWATKNGRFWHVHGPYGNPGFLRYQKPLPKPLGFWKVFGTLESMLIGYARVSTKDQNLDAQIDALEAAGAERIFKEKVTGKTRQRPELDRLLDHLRADDVVVITKYDRLARSLKDLIEIVERIRERGAGFRSLAEDIDTTTPTGRLIFHVFGSIAEFERERIIERTKEGLAAARRRGRAGGRPAVLTSEQRAEVRRMRDEGRRTSEIAELFKVSTQTVRRA